MQKLYTCISKSLRQFTLAKTRFENILSAITDIRTGGPVSLVKIALGFTWVVCENTDLADSHGIKITEHAWKN